MKKILLICLCFLLAFCAGCGGSDSPNKSETAGRGAHAMAAGQGASLGHKLAGNAGSWIVEMYICGTDLESEYGAVTADLSELTHEALPDNVRFVIQTGGANSWQNDKVEAGALNRFIYAGNELTKLESLPDADMGNANTLAEFIRYCGQNYPAEHRMLIIWNHGGGTVGGACLDERSGNIMSLNDMQDALASVYTKDAASPAYDIIGFDACLMATLSTANTFEGFGRYLVASQEVEPGNGWNYIGVVQAFQNGAGQDAATLGRAICDSYMAGCEECETAERSTLSLTDLSKIGALRAAYEQMGAEALQKAANSPEHFFSYYGRAAQSSANYGGNSRSTGYTNMIDLGDFAQKTAELLPASTPGVLQALDAAVLYKVNGPYIQEARGLSCYYPFEDTEEMQRTYADVRGASPHFVQLYEYLATGRPPQGMPEPQSGGQEMQSAPGQSAPTQGGSTGSGSIADALTGGTGSQTQQNVTMGGGQSIADMLLSFNVENLEDHPVDVDDEGSVTCVLNESQMDLLSSVRCNLLYYDLKDDILLVLGSDTNVNADWDGGVFKDNFDGTWPMLDGHPIYVEVTEEGDDNTLYAVPIKLNGAEVNMIMVYDFNAEKYVILGARNGIDEHGVGDRNLIKMKPGDTVTTLHFAQTLSGGEDEPQQVEVDTFQLKEGFGVKDEEVGDGTYMYFFEFITPKGTSATSDMATFKIENGEITTSTDVQ